MMLSRLERAAADRIRYAGRVVTSAELHHHFSRTGSIITAPPTPAYRRDRFAPFFT
jgi:hypothetical protein